MGKAPAFSFSPRNWVLLSFGVFSLAGLGQFFLAHKDSSVALWVGLALFMAALWIVSPILPASEGSFPSKSPLPPLREGLFFFSILLLALFLRAFRINEIQEGIFADQATVALGARKILQGDWNFFLSSLDQQVPQCWIYYLAAGWFAMFGSALESFTYLDVFISTAGAAGAYWVFRELAGVPRALTAFFLLAVMRWNFEFSHKLPFQSQTVLFSCFSLALLLYAQRKGGIPFFGLAGLGGGLGLYSYQALKAFPVLAAVLTLYDFWENKRSSQRLKVSWAAFWLCFLLAATPYFIWSFHHQSLGRREPEITVGKLIHEEGSLFPLLRNLRDAALMFNREGDSNTQSNFESHRMLDDATGIFLVLGAGYALRRFREKRFFYAMAGLGAFCLPSVLSINGAHAGRDLGATPFVALLAAMFLWDWGEKGRWALRKEKWGRTALACFMGGVLAAAAVQNGTDYFLRQAKDPYYLNDFSWPESRVGLSIEGDPGNAEYFLPSRFYGHPTVSYLAGAREGRIHSLDPAFLPDPADYPPRRDFCFFLEDFKIGILGYLQKTYPEGQTTAFYNPLGEIPLYLFRVPGKALGRHRPGAFDLKRGLKAGFFSQKEGMEKPILTRWDPLIDYSFRDLPSVSDALRVVWTGKFQAPLQGKYEFWVATSENQRARLAIDGKPLTDFAAHPRGQAVLGPGWHELKLEFEKGEDPIAIVGLLWKRPGQGKYEFLPNEVLGAVPPGEVRRKGSLKLPG